MFVMLYVQKAWIFYNIKRLSNVITSVNFKDYGKWKVWYNFKTLKS